MSSKCPLEEVALWIGGSFMKFRRLLNVRYQKIEELLVWRNQQHTSIESQASWHCLAMRLLVHQSFGVGVFGPPRVLAWHRCPSQFRSEESLYITQDNDIDVQVKDPVKGKNLLVEDVQLVKDAVEVRHVFH
jgi:hypothetical protein